MVDISTVIAKAMWGLLNVSGILILISALDEIIVDGIFFSYAIHRFFKKNRMHYAPLDYKALYDEPEKRIAIMVPCWHEEMVIENMLRHNVPSIEYKNYDIFIGVYPNDQPTIDAVLRAAVKFTNVHCVISDKPGPTTKAQNLNCVYRYISNYEKENNCQFDIFVFHDSEDIIHPVSLKLYSLLIPRKDMIQIPMFPLAVNYSFATHWTYADEFAENHTKRMIIREAIGGFIPSAGVGTAFSRKTIQLIAAENNGEPFNIHTLTEDYSLALRIHLLGLKAIFLNQGIWRDVSRRKWIVWGKTVKKRVYEIVATRALFPIRYSDAVRQRARWITGIVFQEWWASGWKGNWATRYTLFLDRKGAVTPFINFIAYVSFIYWLGYTLVGSTPTLAERLAQHPWTRHIIIACTVMMVIRLFYRAVGTYRVYGLVPAIFSVPRAVYSNVINFHALLRAYQSFFFLDTAKIKWDKTKNTFPEALSSTNTLGELLIQHKIATREQIEAALLEQKKRYRKLGEILIEQNVVTKQDIVDMLAKQFSLKVVDIHSTSRLTHPQLEWLDNRDYRWLIDNHCLPIEIKNDEVTVAVEDPTNEVKKQKVAELFKPYKVKYVLFV